MPAAPEATHADRDLERKHSDSPATGGSLQTVALHPLSGVFGSLGADGTDQANSRIVSSPVLQRRASGEMRALVMRKVQQGAGNYKTQQLVAQLRRTSVVQRECACGGTCSACRGKGHRIPAVEESAHLQRRESEAGGEVGVMDGGVIPADSASEPLDQKTRQFMEPRFGRDFSDIRVHTDVGAAKSARSLGAEAYTTGRDIYFGAGKYTPSSPEGQHLLAHELTHTVQQANGAVPAGNSVQSHSVVVGSPDSPLEAEAENTADQIQRSPAEPLSISSDRAAPIRRSWYGDAWDATGGRVVNYVGDKIEDAVEWTEDWIKDKIEEYAPGLLKLCSREHHAGAASKIKILDGAERAFRRSYFAPPERWFPGKRREYDRRTGRRFGRSARRGNVVAGACETFAHAAEIVTGIAKSIAGPAFEGIKMIASGVGHFFSFLWDDLLKPAWDAIKSVAGTVWGWIESIAKWIWDATAPIRKFLGRVWSWILDKFGVVWDTGGSILDWLKEKAAKAWEKVYEFLKPILGPLKVIGTGLLIISGIGPIILIWKAAPQIWDALTWLYQQWRKTDFIVAARKTLTEHILPAIVSGAEKAASLLEDAANWMGEQVDSVNTALGGLLNAVGGSAILSLGAEKPLQFVADAFRKFANWVKNDLVKTLRKTAGNSAEDLEFRQADPGVPDQAGDRRRQPPAAADRPHGLSLAGATVVLQATDY